MNLRKTNMFRNKRLERKVQKSNEYYRSEGVVAERRIFFLGALPGWSGRLPPFLRTAYVRRTYVRPCRVFFRARVKVKRKEKKHTHTHEKK